MYVKSFSLNPHAPFGGRPELNIPRTFGYWDAEINDKHKNQDGQGNYVGHRNTEAHDANSKFFQTPEIQIRTRADYLPNERNLFMRRSEEYVLHAFKAHAPIMHGFTTRVTEAGRFAATVDLFPDIYRSAETLSDGSLKKQWGGNDLRFRMAWNSGGGWQINEWTTCITGKLKTYEQEFVLESPATVMFQFQVPIAHPVNGMIASAFGIYETMTKFEMVRYLASHHTLLTS